jgi:methyl-accepting chemotaxis protein
MSIGKKIGALVVVLVLFATATTAAYHVLVGRVRDLGAQRTSEMLLQDYRNELKDLVDAMAPTLAAAAERVKDEAEAHRVFTDLVKNARFFPDRSGYYFIYRAGGTVFVLPTLPDLEGQNLLGRVDPKGTPFIRRLDQVAQAGGGYVEYWFDKPGRGVLPKLSYARMIPGTSWWVGTGVYVDDVEARQTRVLDDLGATTSGFLWKLYVALGAAFLVIVVPLVGFLVRSIINPLRHLTTVAESYSLGELDLEVPGTKRDDEIGSLARALARLGTSMKHVMRRLKVGS